MKTQTEVERFWSLVEKGDGCWEWKGRRNSRGYGVFRAGGKDVLAHRYAIKLSGVSLDGGLYSCHHCDNPPCVRPDHLFAGTNRENQLDSMRKGRWSPPPLQTRHPSTGPRLREVCNRGHALTPDNVVKWASEDHRRCLTCVRIANRKKDARKREMRRRTA